MSQYVKKDCEQGFVTDNAEIDSLKFNNMRHTILGCMLGDFDVNGNYFVEPEIVKELISMPKYIVDTVENIDVCTSVIKLDKQITFFVTYEGERAVLSLAEKVNFQANFKANTGLFSNINEYILDTFETSGVIDKNVVYSKWNISAFTGSALDVFNMDEETLAQYAGIINRFKYLMKANQILLKNESVLEDIEAEYAVNMLGLISKYPELKKCVDEKLKTIVGTQPSVIRMDKPFFAKTVNEIITQTIDNNLNVLDDVQKQEFATERHNATVEHNIKLAQTIDTINAPVVDEKQEIITSKFMLDTFGTERRQSLADVASEYIVTKNETNKMVEQQAVAQVLDDTAKNSYIASTKTTLSTAKDKLIEAIASSVGQTRQQLGEHMMESPTFEFAVGLSTQTSSTPAPSPNLVVKATEGQQNSVNKSNSDTKAPAGKGVKKADAKDGKTNNKGKGGSTANNQKADARKAEDATTHNKPIKVYRFPNAQDSDIATGRSGQTKGNRTANAKELQELTMSLSDFNNLTGKQIVSATTDKQTVSATTDKQNVIAGQKGPEEQVLVPSGETAGPEARI